MPHCDTCQSDKDQSEMVTSSQCRRCKNQKQREWRTRNLNRLQVYRNTPEYRAKFYASRHRREVSSPRNFLKAQLRLAERNSKAVAGRHSTKTFAIDLDYIMSLWETQAGRCAVSGLPMAHKRHYMKSVSIDRIDSTKGYEVGNIQLVCKFINLAKSYHTNDEIKTVLDEYHQLRLD